MKTKITIIGTAFFLLISWVQMGCYKDNAQTLYPTNSCDSTTATWSKDIQTIVTNNCDNSGCHDASTAAAGIDLTTYTGVKRIADDGSFLNVIETGLMPQGSKLDKCTIGKLRNWINNGALNN